MRAAPFALSEAEFKALSWQQQNAALEPHLVEVLRALVKSASTTHVAWALSERTHLPETLLATILQKRFAPHRPRWAAQDPLTKNAFGRMVRRWRWYPIRKDDVSDIV